MRVRWIGPARAVHGGLRVQGEDYELPEVDAKAQIADGYCVPVLPVHAVKPTVPNLKAEEG